MTGTNEENLAKAAPPNEQVVTTLEEPTTSGLTRLQKKNIGLLVLAWCCAQSCFTLIMSTGAVAILSVGGSPSLAPFVVAFTFMGIAAVSATTTHWIFARYGRKIGFFVGSAFGVVGSVVGGIGLFVSSPAVVLVAQMLLGCGGGIGLYLRFAAVEVVPHEYASRAVTWVLAGGCLAAFLGPEVAQATVGKFGDDENLTYLGSFITQACFFALQGVCTGFIEFPTDALHQPAQDKPDETSKLGEDQSTDEEQGYPQQEPEGDNHLREAQQEQEGDDHLRDEENSKEAEASKIEPEVSRFVEIMQVVQTREFMFPLFAAVLSWALLVMTMTIFRVPMRELGYPDRQSLTVIEVNTLARYLPGFWTGHFIKNHGVVQASLIAVVCFALSLGIFMSAQDNDNTQAAWYVGAVFLGVGWNFGFSSATVWSTKAYQNHMHLKAQIQAASECGIFLISGLILFSAGYIYDDWGGGGIEGWRLLNGVLFSLVFFYGLTVVAAMNETKGESKTAEIAPAKEEASIEEPAEESVDETIEDGLTNST